MSASLAFQVRPAHEDPWNYFCTAQNRQKTAVRDNSWFN